MNRRIGWHDWDAANGEDVKVVQLRYGPARITTGVYAQVVKLAKRKAQEVVAALASDNEPMFNGKLLQP